MKTVNAKKTNPNFDQFFVFFADNKLILIQITFNMRNFVQTERDKG